MAAGGRGGGRCGSGGINKNRKVYDPSRDETFKAYRSKFGKVCRHPNILRAKPNRADA